MPRLAPHPVPPRYAAPFLHSLFLIRSSRVSHYVFSTYRLIRKEAMKAGPPEHNFAQRARRVRPKDGFDILRRPGMKILGMDLGQSKSAWEILDTVTGETAKGVVKMDACVLRSWLETHRPDRLVIESGPLAARVHDLACSLGVSVVVADPTQDAWRWKNVKRKTDADDAGKLVRLELMGQINPVHMPSPAVRERRRLLEYRRGLIAEQTRCKNVIRAALMTVGLSAPSGKNGWTQASRQALIEQAKPLSECSAEELWRGLVRSELTHLEQVEGVVATVDDKLDALGRKDERVQRLRTIPGIGPRTAEVIVAVLDEPRRFKSRRQVSAYAGLVPRRYQSGQMDRSGRITKRGNPLLRQMLNQAAWIAVRRHPQFREFYLRVGGSQKKRRKQAIVALMRKMLVVAWALLRDGTRYKPRPLRPDAAPKIGAA